MLGSEYFAIVRRVVYNDQNMSRHPEASTISPIFPPLERRWEEVNRASGVLSLVSDLPVDLKNAFKTTPPWYQPGEAVFKDGRIREEVKLLTLAGQKVIVKKSETRIDRPTLRANSEKWTHSPKEAAEFRAFRLHRDFFLSQFAIITTAQALYRKVFQEELPVEQPLAGYTNTDTGETFMAFAYQQSAIVTDEDDVSNYPGHNSPRARALWERLNFIGIRNTVDAMRNMLVVRGADNSFQPFLIDTQFWQIDPQRQAEILNTNYV